MTRIVLVLHGPNLNLLGSREPATYGNITLAQINAELATRGEQSGVEVVSFQSNHEGVLIDQIHAAGAAGVGYIIINPAGFTHTSVALRDALLAAGIPFVEVHLSNTHAREPFRHRSYFSDIASGVIVGLGAAGYRYALDHAVAALSRADVTA